MANFKTNGSITATGEITGGDHILSHKANVDASNLSAANVTSWKNKCAFEQVDLLYDKDSSDSSINWGYTSGIQSGVAINKSFTKYKQLRIYFQCYFASSTNHGVTSSCVIIDCQNAKGSPAYFYAGMNTPYYSGSYAYNMGIMCQLKETKDLLYCFMNYNGQTQINSQYYVYKIEGVY